MVVKEKNIKFIKVSIDVWKQLNAIKYINNLKTISDAIEFLVNKQHLLEQKLNVKIESK